MARNPAQDKRLTRGDIRLLEKHDIDVHVLKGERGDLDLFKDVDGDVYIKPKSGVGQGEPTGINMKALQ